MGRHLARVPLDFAHPVGTPWGGHDNPHPYADDCPDCGGSGLTSEANVIWEIWYAHQSCEERLPPGRAPKIEYTHPAVQAYSRRQVMRDASFYAPMGDRIVENAIEDGLSFADAKRKGAEYLQQQIDDNAKRLCQVCYNDSLRFRLTDAEISSMQKAGLFDRYYNITGPKLRRRPRSKKRRILNKWRKNPKNWVAEETLRNGETYQPWERFQAKQPRMTRERLITMLVWEGISNVFEQCGFLDWWCKRHNIVKYCPKCNGEGSIWPSEEAKALYENWEETPVPEGPGYQIWNDTSEDQPVTPVFDTLEGVCEWAADNKVSVFGFQTASKEQWMAQFEDKDIVIHEVETEGGGTLAFI